MGHERVGSLPRSKRWRSIVDDLALPSGAAEDKIASIAADTLRAVQGRYRNLAEDKGVQAAFAFLVALCTSRLPRSDGLSSAETNLARNPNPAAISRTLLRWIHDNAESREYEVIAGRAAVDTIVRWTRDHNEQGQLFEVDRSSFEIWASASNARGFCEVARLFFANFTERYLRYFLEREASSAISSLREREAFGRNLSLHIQEVSHHSFETSKITQSFAAGWYNNHARASRPTDSEIKGFLHIAFGKLYEELQREIDT